MMNPSLRSEHWAPRAHCADRSRDPGSAVMWTVNWALMAA